MAEIDYVTRVHTGLDALDAFQWDNLLAHSDHPTPFMRHAYLSALHHSASACEATGWAPFFITLEHQGRLVAACPLYLKSHSYGEYVFDWAWASAYEHHGALYYPKAVIAVPFTPVPGQRLLAIHSAAREALVGAITHWCRSQGLSSAHLLFAASTDLQAAQACQWMPRHSMQFHWQQPPALWSDFDGFLASLSQDKRKKIKQERRKVIQAGVHFRCAVGDAITAEDWRFFYRCYERTYLEHGNLPYLQQNFFERMARNMPENWLMFIGQRDGQDIASSLIAINPGIARAGSTKIPQKTAYGRYWGALHRVDCLHFEACYYQPIEWCIANGYLHFEGGAQGEHKIARALLPTPTTSMHWIAHPGFAEGISHFLKREALGVANHTDVLQERSPFKVTPG